jgi:hypothetical protein
MQPRWNLFNLRKLIQREQAIRYVLISLFSFIVTVSVVRSFLALTGYPQIGSGNIHIAHVLWGGLILYIAAILPLIYLNPRLHLLGAFLSGVGMGLFLDEVGKFITRQYDYFFPAAAPIMYVFLLLLVALIIMIRRPKAVDGRSELVQALEIVREELYRPLEQSERQRFERDMSSVLTSDSDQLHQEMAQHLLDVLHSDQRRALESRPPWWQKLAQALEAWLSELRLRGLLGAGMILLGLFNLKNPLQAWLEHVIPGSVLVNFLQVHSGRQIMPTEAPALFQIRIGLEVFIGVLLLISAGLLLGGKKRLACFLANLSLLISLVGLDMLLFYFEQFSTIGIVLFQLVVLYGVILYRSKYLKSNPMRSVNIN